MATIERRGNYQWRARIRKDGHPKLSRTFDTRADAEKWARAIEREIDTGQFIPRTEAESTTFDTFAETYKTEVLADKRSATKLMSDLRPLVAHFGSYHLIAITPSMIAKFRDQRLKSVSGARVRKEIGLLSRMLKTAQIDYGIHLPHGNPTQLVRLPPDSKARERRVSNAEIEAIIGATESTILPSTVLLAVETAMRLGEIANLEWQHIDLRQRVAHLPQTKNGTARDVPLSSRALEVLTKIPRNLSGRVFEIAPESITRAFATARDRARRLYEEECNEQGTCPDPTFLTDLRFHDLRHEATSRLFERGFEIMEVSTMTGHKDLRMLRRYTHLKAADLAKKLG